MHNVTNYVWERGGGSHAPLVMREYVLEVKNKIQMQWLCMSQCYKCHISDVIFLWLTLLFSHELVFERFASEGEGDICTTTLMCHITHNKDLFDCG